MDDPRNNEITGGTHEIIRDFLGKDELDSYVFGQYEEALKRLAEQGLDLETCRNLSKIIQSLDEKEAQLEILERASTLERRGRKYKAVEPAETWCSRWVAMPIAHLFPPERREEWLGDLYETNREFLHKGYPRWVVSIINLGQTVILVLSACQIKISDFFSIGVRKRD